MTASMDVIKGMFDELDVDGNGTVNGAEVEGIMKKSGIEDGKAKEIAEGMIAECDKDGDAKISWDEFRTAMEALLAEMKAQQEKE